MIQENQHRPLGASGISVSSLGVGTNRWAQGRNDEAVFQVFRSSVDAGVNFFDTAEVYNRGKSERLLGMCFQRDHRPVVIASKFAPLPTRLLRRQFMNALDASLSRLGVQRIDLYYIHFPFTLLSIETLMDLMAQAVETGKIRAVGVSNFNAKQMRRAASCLARYHIPLAANQVRYNLMHRQPEENGVMDACRELNVALVAYRPLERGRLKSNTALGAPSFDSPSSKGWNGKAPSKEEAFRRSSRLLHNSEGRVSVK
jgi:aryl-alcohol dehydrogenase-like predicted oxidoreductase